MAPKSKTIGEIVKSQIKEEYVVETIAMSQMIIEDIIVKLNLNINVKIKYKTRVTQNMCRGAFVNGWIPYLATLSETRTLCQFFLTDPIFSVIYLIITDPNIWKENFV